MNKTRPATAGPHVANNTYMLTPIGGSGFNTYDSNDLHRLGSAAAAPR
ncbi:MAG: hypothetical protein KBA91_03660 [Candidatus Moranbacteria bacterium]|nr:hypothetical protein [Candidatus Moranbacteria bacterium]